MSFDEALNVPMPDEVDCGLDFDAGGGDGLFLSLKSSTLPLRETGQATV